MCAYNILQKRASMPMSNGSQIKYRHYPTACLRAEQSAQGPAGAAACAEHTEHSLLMELRGDTSAEVFRLLEA